MSDFGFHYKNGIYFKRIDPEGTVRVTIRESAHKDAKIKCEFDIDNYGWCSIICAVADNHEEYPWWDLAKAFHRVIEGK